MAKTARTKWKTYPIPEKTRVGLKVSWNYYKSEKAASICADFAKHNARIQEAAGYDFGYQCPGSVLKPGQQNFYPELYEVCLP